MVIPNPELQLADEFLQYTNCNIFLTGKAGTGKTTFLKNFRKNSPKRMVVTAPTGVAAINAGGVTLHSFFQMPFGPFVPGSEAVSQSKNRRFNREKINIIKSMDLLVIDEISMVRSDLLDGVNAVLQRYRRSNLPFGGVQLLMIGDLHQLSPGSIFPLQQKLVVQNSRHSNMQSLLEIILNRNHNFSLQAMLHPPSELKIQHV